MSHRAPAVGRDVLYVSHGTPVRRDGTQAYESVHRPTKITEVDPEQPGRVGLHVVNPTGQFFRPLSEGGAVYDETGLLAGTWQPQEV